MFSVALSTYIVGTTHNSLKMKQGLPIMNQIISWMTLGKKYFLSNFYAGSLWSLGWVGEDVTFFH